MLLAAKYRLYPTKAQEELLVRHFGSIRLIYNLALELKSWIYTSRGINLSRFDLQVQLRELKQEYKWLKAVNSQSLQTALMHLDSAYRKKAIRHVAVLHEKTTNQRNDFLHKASDAITRQYDTICVEELSPRNLVKNHRLALSIQDGTSRRACGVAGNSSGL